ncbi:MAG: GNAT family N-acetyltransferase [Thermodesulfobacteriota bacterium]
MLKKSSKLVLPLDIGYIGAATSYASELAEKIGFSEAEISEIAIALKEALENVITHGFNPYEDETFTVSFDLLKNGIKITIDEMGLPFSPLDEEKTKDAPGLSAIEENMDNALYINMGKEGKELQLFKYFKGKHIEELSTEAELAEFSSCNIPGKDFDYTLRLMKPEEAIDVSRCIYMAYKYTYLNEDLYFPERIEAMNEDGQMISAVAVTGAGTKDGDEEVIAHFALKPRPDAKAAEIGVAVVVPKYRKRGIMKALLRFLIKIARRRGFSALYGNAFTMHILSQKTNLDFDFTETAIQLGRVPAGALQGMKEKGITGVGHIITYFKYLAEPEKYNVFLPGEHSEILKEIYSNLGIERIFKESNIEEGAVLPAESVMLLSLQQYHKVAILEIKRLGMDLEKRVKGKLMELQNQGYNVLFVDLGLKDPYVTLAVKKLAAMGFFFSGLFPDYSEGDVLRLQYYSTEVDYSEIETVSPFAGKLVDYVKARDYRWNTLHS